MDGFGGATTNGQSSPLVSQDIIRLPSRPFFSLSLGPRVVLIEEARLLAHCPPVDSTSILAYYLNLLLHYQNPHNAFGCGSDAPRRGPAEGLRDDAETSRQLRLCRSWSNGELFASCRCQNVPRRFYS